MKDETSIVPVGGEPVDDLENELEQVVPYTNPSTDAFLEKWDRQLPLDRRCFGTKLCFAGGEDRKVRDGLFRIGVRHILLSFFYFKKFLRKRSPEEISNDIGRFDFVILDSGGFTFMQKIAKGEVMDMDIRQYADTYHSELERIGNLFTVCAELDVHDVFNQKEMEATRDRLTAKGVPMLPVLQGQPIEEIKELGWFDKYPYLAVGSALLNGTKQDPALKDYLKYGKKKGTLFHGFGITTVDGIRKIPFYSVDSTTWMSGTRYGNTMIFQNGRLRYYDYHKKDVRKRYRKRFEENGLIWSDIERERPLEVDMMNALGWKQWAEYIKYNTQNAYWLTPEEKSESLTLKSRGFNAEGIINRSASLARAEARRLTQITDADSDDRAHEILHCDTCAMSGRCPRFKEGEPCGYDVNVKLQTNTDVHKALQTILEMQYGRVMTAALFEKLEGGVIDADLSKEI